MKLKKTITAILSFAMIFSMMLGLTGCGSQKKEEAIEAFNKTSEVFDETVELINANPDVVSEATFNSYQEMQVLLTQYKELLEGDDEISDESYDEMIEWFGDAEEELKEFKSEIEAAISANAE